MTRFSVEPDRVDLPSGATAGARRTWIKRDGRPIAALSQNAYRAYIYPLFTPSGVSVTAESPIDHPHHNSVTIGADHFDCLFVYDGHRTERGTYNFYVNETFQGRATGRIASVSIDSEEVSDDTLRIVQRLEWQGPVEWGAPERRVLANETRTIDMSARPKSPTSSTSAHAWNLPTGTSSSALPATPTSPSVWRTGCGFVDGGNIVDADGRSNVQDINANSAAWVDMSATGPHGREVGVTVVRHPSPLPAGWYAHEWGTVAVNPFLHQEQSIKCGETLELGVTVAAHDGPAPLDKLDSVYDEG